MSESNDMSGTEPRWGGRTTERWMNAVGIAVLVLIVLVGALFWWLLFTDLSALIQIVAVACAVAVIGSIVARARIRLRVRRQKREAREDWPRATAREHGGPVVRSPGQED